MIIGFDAKRITHNTTGLGNYSRFIVNALSVYFPEDKYILYSPSKGKEQLRNKINASKNTTFSFPDKFIDKKFPAFWRSKSILNTLRSDKIQLFHGLSNELPFGIKKTGIPSVVTIHDLIFLRYPHYYKPIDRAIYTYKFKKACKDANLIIAVSETTKRDIIDFFSIPEKKIQVVYQNCDKIFQSSVNEVEKQKIREIYQLPERYVLSVGSIEERKNLLLLVKALRYLPSDIYVVAVGKKTAYTEEVLSYIALNNLSNRVKLLHEVPFIHLPALYQTASVFVYPSLFEGFGIPVIEALHSGTPVIASASSCLQESGGTHSIYIDPNDEKALANAIEKVFSDGSLRKLMIEEGRKYVRQFSDKHIADQLHNIYKELVK